MPASVSATPGEQSEPGSDAAPRTELPARPFSPLTCIRPSAAPRIVRSPNPSHGSGSNCGRSNPGCGAGSTYRFPRRCWPCVTSSVGWADSHLFEFVIGDRVYGEPLPDDDFWGRHVYKTAGIRLKTLSSVAWSASSNVYDFADDWRQDIFIESVGDREADVDYPAFVGGGERRCPPEDVGVPGFMQLLEAALDPLHVEQRGVDLVREAVRPGRHRRAMGAAEACHAGRPLARCPRAALRRSAARFDLTDTDAPLWNAASRQLELLSTVSLRTDGCRTAPTGRRRARCRTRRCPERTEKPSAVVPATMPSPMSSAKNCGPDATMRGFRTEPHASRRHTAVAEPARLPAVRRGSETNRSAGADANKVCTIITLAKLIESGARSLGAVSPGATTAPRLRRESPCPRTQARQRRGTLQADRPVRRPEPPAHLANLRQPAARRKPGRWR